MTTIDLFTREFTMPDSLRSSPAAAGAASGDGSTRPPLVERLASLDPSGVPFHFAQKMRFESDEIYEALLIVAAHRWAAEHISAGRFIGMYDIDSFGVTADPKHLVRACHLIADSLRSIPSSAEPTPSDELDSANRDLANAHLIAAAPDLYAACKAAMKFIESVRPGGPVLTGEAELFDSLRAALAKAEGRS